MDGHEEYGVAAFAGEGGFGGGDAFGEGGFEFGEEIFESGAAGGVELSGQVDEAAQVGVAAVAEELGQKGVGETAVEDDFVEELGDGDAAGAAGEAVEPGGGAGGFAGVGGGEGAGIRTAGKTRRGTPLRKSGAEVGAVATEGEEAVVGEAEERAAEEGGEGELVGGILDGAEGGDDVADFALFEEASAAGEVVGEVEAAQGVFVMMEMGVTGHQDGDLAEGDAFVVIQFFEAMGESGGFAAAALGDGSFFVGADLGEEDFGAGGRHVLAVGVERGEVLAEERLEEGVGKVGESLMEAESGGEAAGAFWSEVLDEAAEDGDFGAAEAVDGLFGVADGEEGAREDCA